MINNPNAIDGAPLHCDAPSMTHDYSGLTNQHSFAASPFFPTTIEF